ncbi:Nif3-like dinuclear metal center hexameric protein [Cytobacillus suaedae]|nr:Nif3-like dinuclear metal center hexameric protein [Cytobacillus suaedae]
MSKVPNGFEIIQLFEKYSPKAYAVEGDKIGLQIGTLNKPINTIMIALDVLENVIDEAIDKKVDLIIAHHPPIFRPLKSVITDQPAGKIVEMCIKHDIAVYAAHTNLDVANGGVNDMLAEALNLQDVDVLSPTYEDPLKKLVVYVPETDADTVREAIGNAGAGAIGNYSHCSFNTPGTGTFLPNDDANPVIGQNGKLEQVKEVKIETIIPASLQRKVVSAMLKAHPYEEVAYDIYPLENQGIELGLGRVGRIKQEQTIEEFAEFVKEALDVEGVRIVGNLDTKVKKVAVLGGDGNKYITSAKFKGADVYVTGDIYYHIAHDAMAMGLNIIDAGHYIEKIMKKGVTKVLTTLCEENKFKVNIFPSAADTNPFTFR